MISFSAYGMESPTPLQAAHLQAALQITSDYLAHKGEKDNNTGWVYDSKKEKFDFFTLKLGVFNFLPSGDDFSISDSSTGWFLIRYECSKDDRFIEGTLSSIPKRYEYRTFTDLIDGFEYKVEIVIDRNFRKLSEDVILMVEDNIKKVNTDDRFCQNKIDNFMASLKKSIK